VEERKHEAAPDREEPAKPVPVMDSLFGDAFAPPVPLDELPGTGTDEAETLTPEDAAIERIVRRLNDLRKTHWEWAHYVPLLARFPKNVEKIRQRLRDGHTEQDLILVLEYRAAVDGGDERSRRYFNSDTPFNTRNFEENLAMALDWQARGRVVPVGKTPGTNRGAQYYLQQDGRDQ
jgi:hypothetical protein